jgi:VIT1/CCC1 family predicted Fe2+/Mn2+ transporter
MLVGCLFEFQRGCRMLFHVGDGPSLIEHHHRDLTGGAIRAAIFGFSDGLVSNVALILGVAGARPKASVVVLVGLAGLVAGAFSMGVGEYVSMRAQRELLERELDIEKTELKLRFPNEVRELAHIYEGRGVPPEDARRLAVEMMRSPDMALETHAREELGINPTNLGKPVLAGLSSFVSFGSGAFMPLIPWLITTGEAATLGSVAVGALASLLVGFFIGLSTGKSKSWAAVRQLLLASLAAAVTWGIGRAIGISGLS